MFCHVFKTHTWKLALSNLELGIWALNKIWQSLVKMENPVIGVKDNKRQRN